MEDQDMPYNSDYTPTETGLFTIDFSEYVKIKALNSTYIKFLSRSPLHFKTEVESPTKATPAMNVGSGFHYAVLEPDRYDQEVVALPEMSVERPGKKWNKNSKEHKAWAAANRNKTILKQKDIQNIKAMVKKIGASQAASRLIANGWAEKTVLWKDPEFGFWCKARIDFFPEIEPGAIVDLKKTADASQWGFQKSIRNYRYNWQAYWYLTGATEATGLQHKDFYWIAWEDQPPHEGNVFKADPAEIDRAEEYIYPLRRKYAECLEKDEWLGYPDQVIELGFDYDRLNSTPFTGNVSKKEDEQWI